MAYDPNPGVRKGLGARLGLYVFGIAIGLVMLGFFQAAKKREAEQKQAETERLRSQPVVEDGLFPPVPRADGGKP